MSDDSLAWTLVRAGISLVLVLGLLVLCLRLLAKRGGFTGPTHARVEVEVLGRRQLTRTGSVQVVRVGEEVLVLGVTDAEISTLHHLSPEELAADEGEETDTPPPAMTTPPTFVEALRRQGHLGRLVAETAAAGRVDAAAGRGRRGRHRGGSPGRGAAPRQDPSTTPNDVVGAARAEITSAPSPRRRRAIGADRFDGPTADGHADSLTAGRHADQLGADARSSDRRPTHGTRGGAA